MFRRLPLRHLLRRITNRSAHVSVTDRSATHRRATRGSWRTVRYAAVHLAITALMLSVPAAAFADPSRLAEAPVYLAANDLPTVISNLQKWVMGLLFAVATLFLILGGVYRVTAGGDPAQVEKSNTQFKNALIGYALAVLAPVLLEVVKGVVGG
jgi:Type IV secretion system pilin